jgi:hypothetical protein
LLELELIVDKPKPSGSISSNDGNTAWWVFSDPEFVASTTEIDQEIIKCFAFVLQVISHGQETYNEAL